MLEYQRSERGESRKKVVKRYNLYITLIAMLLLLFLQLQGRFYWALSNLLALLRQQLFQHRDLWAWLDGPFQPPPEEQLELALTC